MGDAAAQKMMETQKAYANLMLHSAQEAAARIMISERRAFRIQKEAEFAKQEALGMLLRLKQTTDSKMREAEVLSFKQKTKINELEGRLQEAKIIVRELREQLAIVCDELERTKKREQLKSPNKVQSNHVAHGSEYAETSNSAKPDTSGSIIESCSNSKVGPNSTLDDNTSTLARRKDEHQSQKTKDAALMTPYGDVLYLPSIIKRTKVPPIYANRLSQGIHALIGNKLGGTSRSPDEIAGSNKNLIADPRMIDSLAVNKDSRLGGKKVQGELTAKDVGSNKKVPEKPLQGAQRRHVDSNAPLYEHLPTWDIALHETTGHCPSKSAMNGSFPSGEDVKHSKREALKAVEASRTTDTYKLKPLPGYVQAKESNAFLVKPCSFKNTTGNDKKEANILTGEGDDVIRPLSTKVGTMDLDFDVTPCNSNARPDDVKLTNGSFPFATNIIQYTRKRSRQDKENTNSNCGREASSEPVCPRKKLSDRQFDLLPDSQASDLRSSKNWESQSTAQVAHQLLALSDKKWFL